MERLFVCAVIWALLAVISHPKNKFGIGHSLMQNADAIIGAILAPVSEDTPALKKLKKDKGVKICQK